MTNHTTTEIIEVLKGIKLPESSRARMRAELSAYADFHAAPAHVPSTVVRTAYLFRHFPLVTAAVVLIMVGGSVTYAANGSLPGSPLYAVKTDVLEPVEKLVTVPQVGEAQWSVTLAQRRLEEADALASTTARSIKDEEQAAHEVAHAARDVEKRLNALPAPAREKAFGEFNKTLSSHERTLGRLAALASTTNATDTEEVLHKLFTDTRGRRERGFSSEASSSRAQEQQSWDNSGNGHD
jgi:hypothetical protein